MVSILGAQHRNQVVYYDPSCASLNIGDEIISDSARCHLDYYFGDKFIVRLSTHQRTSFRYRLAHAISNRITCCNVFIGRSFS